MQVRVRKWEHSADLGQDIVVEKSVELAVKGEREAWEIAHDYAQLHGWFEWDYEEVE